MNTAAFSLANKAAVILGGGILNLGSIVVQTAIVHRFPDATSKGAVLALTYPSRRDFPSHGIRCNAILPDRIHTPFVEGFIAKNFPAQEAEMFKKLSKTQTIGRMGQRDKIATAALCVCSDEASFIPGSAYPVDGGTLTLR
jgi:2-keto-3-deoxy-L-fuconate dehydrogenase